jgi:hypothetical protein
MMVGHWKRRSCFSKCCNIVGCHLTAISDGVCPGYTKQPGFIHDFFNTLVEYLQIGDIPKSREQAHIRASTLMYKLFQADKVIDTAASVLSKNHQAAFAERLKLLLAKLGHLDVHTIQTAKEAQILIETLHLLLQLSTQRQHEGLQELISSLLSDQMLQCPTDSGE